MASPHTAGTVALIWAAAPALTGNIAMTRTILDSTAIDTASTQCGGSAGDNNVWGEGRLDALAAVKKAVGGGEPPPPPPPACTTVYSQNFESGAGGWAHSSADSTCTTGAWGVGDPDYVSNGGVVTQPEDDHTPAPGLNAFFTAPNTGGAGTHDVDNGVCTAYSPTINASAYSSVEVSLWYYHGQRDAGDDSSGDYFKIDLSRDGGATYTTNLVSLGDVTHHAQWTEIKLNVSNPAALKLRVQASDGAVPGDLVEGGIDDDVVCAPQ